MKKLTLILYILLFYVCTASYIQATWSTVTGKPTFARVATDSDYTHLGSKPTIPSNTNQLTNGSGYITSVPAQSFSSITSKPTTLSGYGITDAYPLSGNPSSFLTSINSSAVTTALGYTPTNPNGSSSQYTAGDGTKITFPTVAQCTLGTTTFSGISLQTSYVITHGLSYTPTAIFLQPRTLASSVINYVTTINSSTFTIVFIAAPTIGSNNITLDWIAYK